mmetsp:Transcript_24120/g.30688  ORF Transcript_24120/g.30688 Transcript_24120/m.30688 type:complete len:233 (+) Transcript_24120:86-784(+)
MEVKEIATWTTASAVGYQLFAKLCRSVLRRIATRIDASAETKAVLSGKAFPTYILSMLNAIQSTGWALYKLSKGKERWNDLSGNRESVALINGYLLGDLLLTKRWSKDTATVLHHFTGISLITGLLVSDAAVSLYPDAEIMESSTIFLNIMWFLRAFGKTDNSFYRITLYAFALLFFVTRVVFYPYTIYQCRQNKPEEWEKVNPVMRYGALPSLWLLQLFWFRKIAKMALSQ